MELRLMEAKHEANRTKEETERQADLEREVNCKFLLKILLDFLFKRRIYPY